MRERFSTISPRQLLSQILNSLERGSVFGIYDSLFYTPAKTNILRTSLFDQSLETPVGVAAGPHTQMAQNIVSAWLCGARYIELKTVQTLDQIDVAKPCIDSRDVVYNCEWSQELSTEEAFHEYLKAWILIHILHHKFGWHDEPNTIFNMSIGYDMQGIMQENVQRFLANMSDCSATKAQMVNEIKDLYPAVEDIKIPNQISDNITLSTMHGCPPDEIDQIGRYLIEERKLHTFIKLNPTLLGQDRIDTILNKQLGYNIEVPDQAFDHDIRYPEALRVIRRLKRTAWDHQRNFGVKLTNTLEVRNRDNVLPGKTEYMSGKALHPLSINVARQLRNDDHDSRLRISFCGGVNALNVAEVLACGLSPVTVCTDLLKPGGYTRLAQYLANIGEAFSKNNATDLMSYVNNTSRKRDPVEGAIENLNKYADEVVTNALYRPVNRGIKTARKLTEFDCIHAPCISQCAVHQNIPDYLYFTGRREFSNALEVILSRNPFPAVTGMICDHLCEEKCTRINYESPILIRSLKRFITEKATGKNDFTPKNKNGIRVAIIGSGPSGLSCAYFLALAGYDVGVFEGSESPGGMLESTIPLYRLSEDALEQDISRIQNLGVSISTSTNVDKKMFEEIKAEYDYIYVAVGAQRSKELFLEGKDTENGLIDPLEFLTAVRKGDSVKLGSTVLVLGGGNTAIDAARTAKMLVGNQGDVNIVYRRARAQMPAEEMEIINALEEGVNLIELASPVRIISEAGQVTALVCQRMKLGGIDQTDRPSPVRVSGEQFTIKTDTIIPAFGQSADIEFIDDDLLEKSTGRIKKINLDNIFVGGDAQRGASTVVRAIADGKEVAETIIRKSGVRLSESIFGIADKGLSHRQLHEKRARIIPGIQPVKIPVEERDYHNLVEQGLSEEEAVQEANRCLFCDELCDICVTVCPNRANVSYKVAPFKGVLQKARNKNGQVLIEEDVIFQVEQQYQVFNIADFCNACGNCTTFCPTDGSPFLDKPRVFLTETSFRNTDQGYCMYGETLLYKEPSGTFSLLANENRYIYKSDGFRTVLNPNDFSIIEAEFLDKSLHEITLEKAVKMHLIRDAIRELYE